MTKRPVSESGQLEDLWVGEFGDAYVDRNAGEMEERMGFWERLLERFPARNVLEVGCAHGANLRLLCRMMPAQAVWGTDLNAHALATARQIAPGTNVTWGVARELPFRDQHFDLVFTVGLLIHIPEATLPVVMNEIVRCSRRWVMFGEYKAEETTAIDYRGQAGVLFKRDYGRLYSELFPDLRVVDEGFLTKEQGFDRVTYQILERG